MGDGRAELLAGSFGQDLEMSARCGVLKVGGSTVAIDGAKVLASASKTAAVSPARVGELMGELDLEIEELLRKAGDADLLEGTAAALRVNDEVKAAYLGG